MRGPIAAGVLAGVLVVLVALAGFVGLALGRPDPTTEASTTPPAGPTTAATSPTPGSTDGSATPDPGPTAAPSASPSGAPPPVGLAVGDTAPTIQVPAVGGSEIDTSVLIGQPLWINFMATWCPPCRDELPVMDDFQGQLAEQMTILLIDIGENESTVNEFMTSLGVDLPVGLDRDGSVQREWGAYALPVHYWIDAEGRIGGFLYGGAGPEQFIEGVHTVLPDAQLEP